MSASPVSMERAASTFPISSFVASFALACALGVGSFFVSRGLLRDYHFADDLSSLSMNWFALIGLACCMYGSFLSVFVLMLKAWRLRNSGSATLDATPAHSHDFELQEPLPASRVAEIGRRARRWYRGVWLLLLILSFTFCDVLAQFWGISPGGVHQNSIGLRAAWLVLVVLYAAAPAMAAIAPVMPGRPSARTIRADAELSGTECIMLDALTSGNHEVEDYLRKVHSLNRKVLVYDYMVITDWLAAREARELRAAGTTSAAAERAAENAARQRINGLAASGTTSN